MSNSLIPVAPGFDQPLDMLEACHERLQAQLHTLEKLARWLPEHGADEQARRAAANVMRYFDNAATNHHCDEENDLLPALHARVADHERAELEALSECIIADHRRLSAAWEELRVLLAEIADGHAADLTGAGLARFVDDYRKHLAHEEDVMLPFARRLLGSEALEALGASMTARRTSGRKGG